MEVHIRLSFLSLRHSTIIRDAIAGQVLRRIPSCSHSDNQYHASAPVSSCAGPGNTPPLNQRLVRSSLPVLYSVGFAVCKAKDKSRVFLRVNHYPPTATSLLQR